MNKEVKHLISKYFDEDRLPPAYVALFDEVSQLIEDRAARKSQSTSASNAALRTVMQRLQDSLHVFGSSAGTDECGAGVPSLIHLARKLKKECADRIIRQQKQLREMKHLKTIQSLASAGSWELPITNDELILPGYWSDELFTVLGARPGITDTTSRAYRNYVHPDDRQLLAAEVSKAIRENTRYDIEYRILREGDPAQERTVREVGVLVRDEASGKVTSLIGVTFDISDIRNTERALFKANVELRKLFDVMEDVFFSYNMELHKLLQISPSCMQLYGYSVDEFYSTPDLWFIMIHDDDKEAVQEGIKRLGKGGSDLFQYRIRHKSGAIRWVETRMTPTLGQDGLPIRLDGITSDITKRREAELALENSELKFRSLLENSNDAITVASEDLKFLFATQSLSRMIGYSVEEITGTPIFDFIHPDDHATVNGIADTLIMNPDVPVHFEIRFRVKAGGWIWCEGSVTNHLKGDIVSGYIGNFRDVTYKIRYRKALEASNNRLKKTNNELDRFVYSVSHDLRAPLASVLGLIEYTMSETEEEEVLQDLGMMKVSIEKLDRFILDILDYSRNARLEIKVQAVNFHQLLEETKDNLKFLQTGGTTVRFETEVQENGTFGSDERRISILLNNLVSNALRYADTGKPDPFVEVKITAGPEGASIIVRDNGIGIAEEYHERIFDMFFRVSEKSNGSGLGLYLVKETVDKLKGQINLESAPGKGTTFNIFLPSLF